MFIFGARKIQNGMLKQIVVGVLSLMIATTSFLNTIAHFDLGSEKRDLDTHQQMSSFKSEATNKIQIPLSNNCQDADEAHLCVMAILSKNSEFARYLFETSPIQFISDKALSHLNLGPFRPPTNIL